tara:strand:+ start:84 stop:458 length:375 start_codon:yes stop_codon:yes gene_type:complete
MKLVLLFFLFLAISYYIYLQRKKIIEGHYESRESKAAAKSGELKVINKEIENKKKNVRNLLNEVKALIKEEKQLSEAVKELENEEEEGKESKEEPSVCNMTDCKTIKSNRKCSEFKNDSGMDCQ